MIMTGPWLSVLHPQQAGTQPVFNRDQHAADLTFALPAGKRLGIPAQLRFSCGRDLEVKVY